jgi:hypothetical protein
MGHHHAEPPADTIQIPAGHVWNKIPMIGLGLAVVGLLGAWFTKHDAEQFAFSYLVAFFYVLTLTLGCLFFTLFQHASRAGWSVVVRRTSESIGSILPVIVLLFIPVYLARHDLYHHWMSPHALEDPIIEGKSKFLNEGFWSVRVLVYAAVWTLLGTFFYRTSVKQDESHAVGLTYRLEKASYISIPLFAFSITFAAFDWGMSLDPHWFSTMWGVYMFAGSIMSGFALLALISVLMLRSGLLTGWANHEHLHDLGKLMYGFNIFWTYIAFSQYFLIWYSNIPEETVFYAHRQGSWETVGIALMVGHFILPFLLLMPRTIKRNPVTLAVGAAWLLVMHFIDLYYIVMPGSPEGHHGFHLAVSDLLVWIGLVGVFVALVALAMKRAKLVPVGDPRLGESLAHVNF